MKQAGIAGLAAGAAMMIGGALGAVSDQGPPSFSNRWYDSFPPWRGSKSTMMSPLGPAGNQPASRHFSE